ncbi:MAG: serine hydrolase [Simkaniaceae bacterium]|nr:serine hydrolase [Simkaniaceae bacterium]
MRCLFFLFISSTLIGGQLLDEKIEAFAKKYQVNGITVGILPDKEVVSYGKLSFRSLVQVNEETIFRVGYLTQLFTSYVLAQLVQDGRAKLTDPISTFLSRNTQMPCYEGEPITLLNLATHTSGLPDAYFNPESFSVGGMFRFLKAFELPYAPGAKYQFSNLGYALLTHLLGRIARQGYPNMVDRMIVKPQHLDDTSFSLTKDQKRRLAIGSLDKQEVKENDGDNLASVFIGSRGLYSSLNDLMTFTLALMKDTPVTAMMKNSYFHFPKYDVALGMLISPQGVYSIESSLFGYSSLIYFTKKEGIIILANQGDVPLSELAQIIFKSF